MSSNFGDYSTVVGDPVDRRADDIPSKASSSPVKAHTSRFQTNTGKSRMSEFTTVDYTIQDRPFFVPIGKDGVIAALEKLDSQLLGVGSWHTAIHCVVYLLSGRKDSFAFQEEANRLDW